MTDVPQIALNDGHRLPAIGFGTYTLSGDDGIDAITSALDAGYRLIDTAVNYGNEGEVGEALRRAGLPRGDVHVTSKIPGRHHGADAVIDSTKESLQRLGLDFLDLHLIHWPMPKLGKFVEAWEGLIELQKQGLVRSIGVSNFHEEHLDALITATGVTPAVNQIELHPVFPQADMREVNAARSIVTQSWSPLGRKNSALDEEPVMAAADAHGVSPAQVVLRWHLELGAIPIPRSTSPERQRENLDVFGFELSADEVAAISALARADGRWFGGDPNTYEEM